MLGIKKEPLTRAGELELEPRVGTDFNTLGDSDFVTNGVTAG
jgi:hypothetical protein